MEAARLTIVAAANSSTARRSLASDGAVRAVLDAHAGAAGGRRRGPGAGPAAWLAAEPARWRRSPPADDPRIGPGATQRDNDGCRRAPVCDAARGDTGHGADSRDHARGASAGAAGARSRPRQVQPKPAPAAAAEAAPVRGSRSGAAGRPPPYGLVGLAARLAVLGAGSLAVTVARSEPEPHDPVPARRRHRRPAHPRRRCRSRRGRRNPAADQLPAGRHRGCGRLVRHSDDGPMAGRRPGVGHQVVVWLRRDGRR